MVCCVLCVVLLGGRMVGGCPLGYRLSQQGKARGLGRRTAERRTLHRLRRIRALHCICVEVS